MLTAPSAVVGWLGLVPEEPEGGPVMSRVKTTYGYKVAKVKVVDGIHAAQSRTCVTCQLVGGEGVRWSVRSVLKFGAGGVLAMAGASANGLGESVHPSVSPPRSRGHRWH